MDNLLWEDKDTDLVILHHPGGVSASEDCPPSPAALHSSLHGLREVVDRRVELRVPPEGGLGRAQQVQEEEGVDPIEMCGGAGLTDLSPSWVDIVGGPELS